MTGPSESSQRLSRLAPLPEALARVDALARPVEPCVVELIAAAGRVLAADVMVEAPVPATAIALRDGWAVRADLVVDAGPYAPQPLTPKPCFVEIGAPLPRGTDAVLAPDAVAMAGGTAEALASAFAGEGVLAAGADAEPGRALRRAGERVSDLDLALLRAAGVPRLCVREPRLHVVTANARIDAVDDTVALIIARAIERAGGIAPVTRLALDGERLDQALAVKADATIVIGGTGMGRGDASVRTLARVGRVDIHGIGLVPGGSAAIGSVGARPVLVVPGRLDAALAVWLVVGRRLLARLSGYAREEPGVPVRLARKIVSAVGLAEVVPVARGADGVEPVAAGVFPLQALARAEGWVLVTPESEGFAAGSIVEMRAFS